MSTPSADDALKQKLLDYMGHLEVAVRHGSDFAVEQAPAVAREIVAYNLGLGIVQASACLGIVAGTAFAAWRLARKDKGGPNDPPSFVVWAGWLLVAAIPTLGLCLSLNNILMCWLAPRYFILQEILRMTAGRN